MTLPVAPMTDKFRLPSLREIELLEEADPDALVPFISRPGYAAAFFKTLGWIIINVLATIGIVFTNKAIFSDPSWKHCQLSFASFHFFVTWLTLYILSRPNIAYFVPRRAPIKHLVPLALSMCLNVILPNLSLAYSSVTFYQVARVLLSPIVALMNFILTRETVPKEALLALVPTCIGVGMVTYYDSVPTTDIHIKTTAPLGVVFAFSGILASSLYTVWIGSYLKKLNMNSMQLLYNQSPIASFLLLYLIPFVDTFPDWANVPMNRWVMIFMSGIFASLINLSQFFIVAQTDPVSSTVIGHFKTGTIVGLGWISSGRPLGDTSITGAMIALTGIFTYSIIMVDQKAQTLKAR